LSSIRSSIKKILAIQGAKAMRVLFVTADELDDLKAEVAQLRGEVESLRLQTVPSATPEPTDEEVQEIVQPSNVLPFAEHEQAAVENVAVEVPLSAEQQAAIDAVKKADEEHLRLNTKELPKE
jgi:hypothetical protein